jgi:four helix bundle protein
MAGVSRFEDLAAWQRAVELRTLALAICRQPRVRQDWKFRSQLEDASASAPRNIAEGFGRFHHKEFARFVVIARASEQEVLNHFHDAVAREYLAAAALPAHVVAARRALKAASGLIRYLESTPDTRT